MISGEKNMKDNYVFPATIEEEEDQLTISFPTFDGISTCVERGEDLIEAAQELLALTLIDYQDNHREIPEAVLSDNEGQKIIYIHVWLPYFRSKTREVYVKKTLTIPAWLDMLAKQNDINFSAALTEALKSKLNVL